MSMPGSLATVAAQSILLRLIIATPHATRQCLILRLAEIEEQILFLFCYFLKRQQSSTADH